jgi:hypothetical protein
MMPWLMRSSEDGRHILYYVQPVHAREKPPMSKYVETTHPQKTVGAYLKVVKALNELEQAGELVSLHPFRPELRGIVGRITQDSDTGEWSFVQA